MKGLGENGEFGHISVFEKNEFQVLDVGSLGPGRMSGGMSGGGAGLGIGEGVSAEGVRWISGGEGVEGVSRTPPG